MKNLGVAFLMLIVLAGCSSQAPKTTQEEKPKPKQPELLTGRAGFYKTLPSARGWKSDAQLYRVMSQPNTRTPTVRPTARPRCLIWRS